MSNGLQAVARGLRVTYRAFLFTVIFAVLFVTLFLAVGVFGSGFLRKNPDAGMIYVGFVSCLAFQAVVCVIVGFVGRCRCLATPPEFPTARTRIRLAVILEGCGWMGGATSIGVGVAITFKIVPQTMATLVVVTVGLSVLMFILGRVMFLRFARSLAESTDDSALARQSKRSLLLFVIVSAGGVAGFGLLVFGGWSGASTMSSLTLAMSGGLFLAAAGVGVYGLFVYARLLRQLSDAASELASHTTAAESVL